MLLYATVIKQNLMEAAEAIVVVPIKLKMFS